MLDLFSVQSIPLAVKILYTLFVCVVLPTYWRHYGPANFLWFSDLALPLFLHQTFGEYQLGIRTSQRPATEDLPRHIFGAAFSCSADLHLLTDTLAPTRGHAKMIGGTNCVPTAMTLMQRSELPGTRNDN